MKVFNFFAGVLNMTPNMLGRACAVVAGLGLLATPAQSQACCLFGHCHRQTTFYAPPVMAAPVCNPCMQQTVNYVPQVAYRPMLTTTPVTALRPVTAADPCTGCPTTVMQPTTAYMQRSMMAPYTTYRPVVQTNMIAPAPTMTYYQPAAAYQPAVAPMISTPAPAITSPGCCGATSAPAPTTFGPPVSMYRSAAPALTYAPAYAPSNSAARTASKITEPEIQTTKALKPIPDLDREPGLRNNAAPLLWDPQNKTTSMPNALPFVPVARKESTVTTSAPRLISSEVLDNSGWEAAR
jgi:hypothetical protein